MDIFQIDRVRTNGKTVRVLMTDENGATDFLAQIHRDHLPLFTVTTWQADDDCGNPDHWELQCTSRGDEFMVDFGPNARTHGPWAVGDMVTSRMAPAKMYRRWRIDRLFVEKCWLRVLWDDGSEGSLIKGSEIKGLLKLPPVRIGEQV